MQEKWKSIEGYEGKYEISNLGRVKSLIDNNGRYRELILRPRISKNGYLYLNLWKESECVVRKIHRLVAEAFCEKCDNAQCVNHINGVKTDNRADNLEWCTYSYNTSHAFSSGFIKPTKGDLNGMYGLHGKDNPLSKMVLQYDTAGRLIKEWENGTEAGKALNVWPACIHRCARGERKTAFGYIWKYKEFEANGES